MSQLTLQLPETLHQQLTCLAESEGISLNQYIIYALTRQAVLDYTIQSTPTETVNQQQAFQALLQDLGQASFVEVQSILDQREVGQPELSPEIIARFQQRIRNETGAFESASQEAFIRSLSLSNPTINDPTIAS